MKNITRRSKRTQFLLEFHLYYRNYSLNVVLLHLRSNLLHHWFYFLREIFESCVDKRPNGHGNADSDKAGLKGVMTNLYCY